VFVHHARSPLVGRTVLPWDDLSPELRAASLHAASVHVVRHGGQWRSDFAYVHELPDVGMIFDIGTAYAMRTSWIYEWNQSGCSDVTPRSTPCRARGPVPRPGSSGASVTRHKVPQRSVPAHRHLRRHNSHRDRLGGARITTLTIDRQLVTPTAWRPAFGPLKTSRSHRNIPLANFAVAEFAAHAEDHGTGRDGVLLHEKGRPLRRQRLGQVRRSVRSGGRPEKGPTCLTPGLMTPGTYASVLLSGGVSVAAVADYLGHSPVLLRTYAHLMPADHERARSAVDAAFTSGATDPRRASDMSSPAS
jgi:hypothetical protein